MYKYLAKAEVVSLVDMESSVKCFYAEKHIFITGSTGFLGSVVVEKLLRSFPDIGGLYLLIRKKKKRDGNFKFTYFENQLFVRMRKENPKFNEKVHWIEGDLSQKNLGMSIEDVGLFQEKIQIVLHIGASINLDKNNLHEIIVNNLQGTKELLNLARNSPQIKCFMNVSTAFVYARRSHRHTEEKIYPTPISAKDLLNLSKILPPDILDTITPKIISDWPNPYTFVKNATENLCLDYSNSFPIGIFRPGNITSTLLEPFPYWTNSLAGILGYIHGISNKTLKSTYLIPEVQSHAIPVDLTANALLATAYNVANLRSQNILIYNFTSSNNPVTYLQVGDFAFKNLDWKLKTEVESVHRVNNFLLHALPAYLADLMLFISGQKTKYRYLYGRLKLWDDVTEYFRTEPFSIDVENIIGVWASLSKEDQTLLNFDVNQINWKEYFENVEQGMKKYFFKN